MRSPHARRAATRLLLLLLAALPGATLAQSGKPLTPQQQRMSDCSRQSAGQAANERSAFMSRCLKGPMPPMVKASPQQNMTRCAGEAKRKALKGDDRQAFMSQCLKGAPGQP